MNKIVIWIFLFVVMTTLASAAVEVHFSSDKVTQGSLQKTTLKIDSQTAQSLELQKLKGQTIGGVLYFYSVAPMMRKEGGSEFESEATVIFTKVPESSSASYKTSQSEVTFKWEGVEVIPVEAPQEFLFGTFEIPARSKILLWLGIAIALILIVLAGFKYRKTLLKKREVREKKRKLRDEIQSASSFKDVVTLWQKKRTLVQEFPHLEEPFKKLEKTLFKHQFKPTQTEEEKNEVMKAWRSFLDDSNGGFNGI